MAQKLILPINKAKLTASWKTAAYKNRFGVTHYGIDLISTAGSTIVYASGTGTVLAAGWDSVFGNIAVVRYPGAYNRVTRKYADLIIRYYHFASVSVKKGQAVTKDTVLGQYGATGQLVSGAHLHLEVDTDTQWPFFTPTLSGQSTFFKGSRFGAYDRTMSNPTEWLHCKTTAPDYQSWTTAGDSYIRAEDRQIASIA